MCPLLLAIRAAYRDPLIRDRHGSGILRRLRSPLPAAGVDGCGPHASARSPSRRPPRNADLAPSRAIRRRWADARHVIACDEPGAAAARWPRSSGAPTSCSNRQLDPRSYVQRIPSQRGQLLDRLRGHLRHDEGRPARAPARHGGFRRRAPSIARSSSSGTTSRQPEDPHRPPRALRRLRGHRAERRAALAEVASA